MYTLETIPCNKCWLYEKGEKDKQKTCHKVKHLGCVFRVKLEMLLEGFEEVPE